MGRFFDMESFPFLRGAAPVRAADGEDTAAPSPPLGTKGRGVSEREAAACERRPPFFGRHRHQVLKARHPPPRHPEGYEARDPSPDLRP